MVETVEAGNGGENQAQFTLLVDLHRGGVVLLAVLIVVARAVTAPQVVLGVGVHHQVQALALVVFL